ncbi:hypothetical protein PG993_012329 [Apiospora rasikravindrae]|uniref:Nephrocystin 3-like N-terminal domain-containing protein n=1 Tax=Apiospora rasikravindrae TaxID=990691 RepID=A0ABR1S2L9_9PEZI
MESQGGKIANAPDLDDFEIVARDAVPLQPLSSKPSLAERRSAIQSWLQPTEYLSPGNELMKHVHSHVPGTGSWVREAPAFQTWSGSAKPGCLAIKGVAGSGKSVFAASTIHQLQQSEPDTPVLFFFFRQIVEKNHNAKYLVRDFASQLLPCNDTLLEKLEKLSKSSGVDGSEHGALWDALVEAIHRTSKVYCVVDALDEMDDEDFDVISRLCSISNHHDSRARVLLTCRPIPKIEDALRGLAVPQLKLEPSLIYPDVAKYVSVSMATLELTLSPEKEDLVKQTICERAQGLFLHARLMTDNLTDGLQQARVSKQTLPDSLERLPRNLTEVYDDMLLEHAKRSGVSREEQSRILMCVTHSTRPLRLIELGSLVARMKGTDDLKEGKALVKASCGRLLEILEDESVSVIHHSFTEFLHDETRSSSSSSFPVLDATSAHAMLVELSLQYLDACPLLDFTLDDPYQRREALPDPESGSGTGSDGLELHKSFDYNKESEEDYEIRQTKIKQRNSILEEMTLNRPLMNYAIHNLFHHIKEAGSEGRVFDALDAYLLPGKPAFAILMLKFLTVSHYRGRIRLCWEFSVMHLVAIVGMVQYFQHLTKTAGVKLDQPDGSGRTPLSYAAENGYVDIVGHLLEHGVNPESDADGLTPLHYAASAGQIEVSKLLLEAGVNPLFSRPEPSRGRYDRTALRYACENGSRNLIDLFLRSVPASEANRCFHWASGIEAVEATLSKRNVDVDSVFRGTTKLYKAVEDLDCKLLEVLLAHGANPNIRCRDPLDCPDDCTNDYTNDCPDESDEVVKLTIDVSDGPTSMHAFAGFPFGRRNLYSEERVEAARKCLALLVDHGGQVNMKASEDSQTPLHYAVKGDDDLAFWGGRNIRGETPLHCACPGSPDLVDILVRHGADIDAVDENGFTPLLTMMSQAGFWHDRPDTKLFKRLIDHGANVNKATNKGNTVLHMVMMNLQRYNEDDLPYLLSLLRAGGDLSKKNHDGLVPLLTYGVDGWHTYSPSTTSIAILEAFVEKGMDINARDNSGETILWKVMGSSDGGIALMKQLIGLGADPRVRRYDGSTLLHAAVGRFCNLDWIRFLVSCGIDPTIEDPEGSPLVHLALSTGFGSDDLDEKLEYVQGLVELGASATARNGRGQSALHLASSGHLDDSYQEQGREHWIDFVLTTSLFACTNINEQDNEGQRQSTMRRLTRNLMKRNILDQHSNLKTTGSQQRSPLHYACRSGNPESVRQLLKNGADPSLRDSDGYTPLHVLAEFPLEQQLWKAKEFGRKGMNSLHGDSRPTLSYGRVQETRAADIVSLLVETGADLESKVNKGGCFITLMDLAIENGFDTMVVELLQRGILSPQGVEIRLAHEKKVKRTAQELISITDPEEISQAVGTQLENGNVDAIEEYFRLGLLKQFKEKAYQVNYPPWTEEEFYPGTLLTAACNDVQPKLHVIKTLVESVGVDVNAVSNRGRCRYGGPDNLKKTTALHFLAEGSHFWQIEALEYLLEKGADTTALDAKGRTALLAAISTDHPNGFWKEHTIQILLEHGSDPNVADKHGVTCLEHADGSKVAQLLFQYGANLSGSPNALSRAVKLIDPLLVKVLLENGADACEMADKTYVLHEVARRRFNPGIGRTSWKECQLSVIRLLLGRGANPFLEYDDGTTVLQAVIEEKEILGPFFELEGLDMERRGRDERTLLISACIPSVGRDNPVYEYGIGWAYWEAAFLALERGADPNAIDATGRVALHWLCTMEQFFDDEHKLLLASLVDAGPSVVHLHDRAGSTPLHLALRSFQPHAINTLLEHGATPGEPDPQGDTALHHCARHMTGRKSTSSQASDMFMFFLGKGLNINARNRRGETPLHVFMASGWERDRQEDFDRRQPQRRGAKEEPANMEAVVSHTDPTVLAIFWDAGADWHCVDDEEGSSLLHVVASRKADDFYCAWPRGRLSELAETFEMLRRDVGLDPRLEDKRLRTPLDLAVARDRREIVDLFSEEKGLSLRRRGSLDSVSDEEGFIAD